MPVKETKIEYDSNYSSDGETESEEEESCIDFFSNQEFLTTNKKPSTFMKEGRMQIEGGSHFAQRQNVYNDLVEDLMEYSKEDSRELSREEYVNKMENELKVIKDSKSRDGNQLKAL